LPLDFQLVNATLWCSFIYSARLTTESRTVINARDIKAAIAWTINKPAFFVCVQTDARSEFNRRSAEMRKRLWSVQPVFYRIILLAFIFVYYTHKCIIAKWKSVVAVGQLPKHVDS
jgi:hypothetical protein